MRIGFISTMEGEPWGGSEELWSQTAAHFLAAGGHTVGVNVARWPQTPAKIQSLKESGALTTLRPRQNDLLHNRLRRVTGDRRFAWLQTFRPDFVVLSQGSTRDAHGWARACCEKNIKFVTITQAVYSNDWPSTGELHEYSWAYEKALATFFVSQDNLHFARQQLLQPLKNASVVRNPFNVPHDIQIPWPENDIPLKLACVGRLHFPTKAQDVIIDVLREPKWRERALEVTLFGNGFYRANIEKMIAMHKITNVRLGGHVADVASIWREHHALLLPSREEGLPLAVVEALLCARPCIVTDVAGNTELVQDGINGFVAPAPRARSVDATLERVWEKRAELQKMGEFGAQSVREHVPADPGLFFYEQLLKLFREA